VPSQRRPRPPGLGTLIVAGHPAMSESGVLERQLLQLLAIGWNK